MLDDIALFVEVVNRGSLAAGAKQVKLPAATVTRRIQRLEAQLGVKLMHRSARKLVLTHDGEVYFQTYAELVQQFNQAQQVLSQENQQLAGKVKVLAPVNISHGILRTMWVSFTNEYPDIQLDLELSNHQMDLIETQADLAIRIGKQPDSSFYQRRLGELETVLIATPAYLKAHGEPSHPSELVEHNLIGISMRKKWVLHNYVNSQSFTLYPQCRAQINDPVFVKYFVLDSQGIALVPLTEVKNELDSGEAVRILPDWKGEVRDIFLIWPGGKLLSKRAQCLRDYIFDYMNKSL
ncbi:MAG: LysR family transcriptional regulator [Aestuariibacter sp.]|jgi:LysR family transcriptional regulator AphB|uniref:LysR family transcriptional regulator n=1 Tax=Marisediminitalea aggregata TaxID=634436 RepID=UPI0020CD23E4|nr:LysR family transcriptional regulator [Marisediminitalea aggregata]MCP3862063.1 LysR family transcriptional regulator [Aestuariibacter sp.]MCP4525691.1 LysR family transcriptional regulator [Aestuariibacter sp.]MCP4949284.1 LysR family transcriptional regulator [Aestuariibacter sp.]MCP9478117.1 LysR family transcriptional regulator [Marisediminitalea aggregata]|tara:strand:- start:239 stop:1120 length:882 start_codon:yes stop_codon:yes gene_type:complete